MKISAHILVFLFFVKISISQNGKITPENALSGYIQNGDKTYGWELKDSLSSGKTKLYQLLLNSQQWHGIVWRHQLTIIVPGNVLYQNALLFITGGSNKDGQPNWSKTDGLWAPLTEMAEKNKAIVAILRQVPNQPLFNDLVEDALISHTLNQYKKDADHSWPLLFPMVKAAVRAMDATQEFSKQKLSNSITDFTITGASKRGWTTWLSAAIDDPRVKAIAPMVIDMLNMPATLNYQYQTYGEYSSEIEDYVKLGIPQAASSPEGQKINTMIDPYSYRSKLGVPKIVFIGTNDPYWTVDATKHYWDEIPGQNMIHYVPNAGHNLGGGKQAMETLGAFWGLVKTNQSFPVCHWKVSDTDKGVQMVVSAFPDDLMEVTLWETTSADKDFRNNLWVSKRLKYDDVAQIKIIKPYPKNGHQAFYLDLKYKDPNGGTYSVCSRIYVSDHNKLW